MCLMVGKKGADKKSGKMMFLPCNAGYASSIPHPLTKIPHAAGQLNPQTRTTEFVPCNERSCMTQKRYCMPQLRSDAAK